MKIHILPILLIAMVGAFAAGLGAQTKQRLRFAPSSSTTSVKGSVRGYVYKDYVLQKATAGQTLDVKLESSNRFGVFTIFLPNDDNLEGAAESDAFTGELPAGGDYVIRVFMMRSEARRPRSVASYTLKVSIK